MRKYYFTVFILTLCIIPAIVFAALEVGFPFKTRALKFDEQRREHVNFIKSEVNRYYRNNNKLPLDLMFIDKMHTESKTRDPETNTPYEYLPINDENYKICALFSYSSSDNKIKQKEITMSSLSHPEGRHCFDFVAAPISKPVTDNNVSCKTLGGKLVNGSIGCDVEVKGRFDLSKSYCVGMKSSTKEYLKHDLYGRPNLYYATLKNIEPDEEVRVYIYTLSGNRVECRPVLNATRS